MTKQARHSAKRAAKILRDRFGGTRVAVFIRLVHPSSFTRWSDFDLAAWGISPEDIFKTIGAMMDLGEPIEINLVDITSAHPSLKEIIEKYGVDI